MHFSDIKAATPPDIPVASIKFRGHDLDIFRITSDEIFFLLNAAPGVVDAWSLDESEPGRLQTIISEVGKAGPKVVRRLIAAGVRAPEDELGTLDLGEEVEILLAVLTNGIPDELVGKIMAGIAVGMDKAGMKPVPVPAKDEATPPSLSSLGLPELDSIPTA